MSNQQFTDLIYSLKDKYNVYEEVQFDTKRKWRFDFVIENKLTKKRVAIEYEGIQVGKEGKSRHTTLTGMSNDQIKYNTAEIQGWHILKYSILNYKNVIKDIELFFS
jgi:hypothetical protein